MSGATGALPGGAGPDRHQEAVAGTGGARGQAAHGGPSYQGGTVTDARPAHQGAQPHRPPQAYLPPQDQSGQQYDAPSSYGGGDTQGGAGQSYGAPETHGGRGGARRPRPAVAARTAPRTRKARLRVAKADPWSVMKVSFLLSVALGVCTVVAVAVLWTVMDAMGVFATVGGTISEATGSGTDGGFDLEGFLSLSRVLLFTSIVAVIDVVLLTALATLGAFVYNISAGFAGGVELTLAEDE
ncbi:DUF3566 domain-containing protein [Streptomyces sp. NPDC059506]|uniref:DUF3566 domain-containing protein n=1 Tax=Streptomyces TaxID=1883 RepID=UPI0015FD7647|nr:MULTISPECIES: DUF3566 domain-containing protein [unclassified Streptomyces]MCZ2524679.1 DUF3566 domain-containing protein [Streptomyces sp. HB2AG]QMV22496.1 DUF3566 domain-containing protein [Streptomyces sp. SCUT-3]